MEYKSKFRFHCGHYVELTHDGSREMMWDHYARGKMMTCPSCGSKRVY